MAETAIGPVEVTWGINRWVLVDAPTGSLKRQVSSRAQLAALLVELGQAGAEADRVAAACRERRPADAGFRSARRNEAAWRSTGLPAWAVGAILLGVVALFVVLRLLLA